MDPAASTAAWTPVDLAEDRPKYLAMADALSRDVAAGRLKPGDRLPTHRALARALGVHVMTVSRGYGEAARRGLVEGTVGRGTFVRGQASAVPAALRAGDGERLVDFNFNVPLVDPLLLDAGPVLDELARDSARVPLATGYLTRGLPEHRAAGAAWMARSGAAVDVDRVLVCGGAQQAMTLALSLLVEPGEVVLADEVTYPGLKTLTDLLRVRLVGVAGDAEGMLPDALAAAAMRNRSRVVFTLPNVHNPTGVVLGAARRAELVEVARRHGLSFVEDDTYGFLLDDAPPPLAALAPERTWFVASTSKAIAPGLRIGYLAVPDEGAGTAARLDRVEGAVTAVGWMAAPLMGEIATRWIDGGAADRIVAAKRREIALRRGLVDRLLGPDATASHPASCHVWLPLPTPWRPADLAAAARERGVALAPAEVFVAERARVPRAVRVCIGTPTTRGECERGLGVLVGLLAGAPAGLV
jgi:DNA-binding transcriptional MocR family regulator